MGKRTIPGKMFPPPGRIALRLPNPGPACGRWIMNVRVSYLVTAIALLPTSACSLAGLGVVTGSGTPLTMQYEEKGFTAVEVHGAFQVDITRAKNFDVSVTGDDNLLEFVRVTERGGTLTIDFEPGKIVRTRSELKASIALPELEAVALNGALYRHGRMIQGWKRVPGRPARRQQARRGDRGRQDRRRRRGRQQRDAPGECDGREPGSQWRQRTAPGRLVPDPRRRPAQRRFLGHGSRG